MMRTCDQTSDWEIDRKMSENQIKTFQQTPLKPPRETPNIAYEPPRLAQKA